MIDLALDVLGGLAGGALSSAVQKPAIDQQVEQYKNADADAVNSLNVIEAQIASINRQKKVIRKNVKAEKSELKNYYIALAIGGVLLIGSIVFIIKR